jgi:hypothetical protein
MDHLILWAIPLIKLPVLDVIAEWRQQVGVMFLILHQEQWLSWTRSTLLAIHLLFTNVVYVQRDTQMHLGLERRENLFFAEQRETLGGN